MGNMQYRCKSQSVKCCSLDKMMYNGNSTGNPVPWKSL